ncbi:MAG TPA: hydrogenase accessory protein HypB [Cytophagales bacterium]|jgi:hydrogenase nickel incorporation protein HypB|nr:hydrogenase accessory protein HypB [Cytophagales bacterium]
MCATCGCDQPEDHVKILLAGEKSEKSHHHEHHHSHDGHHHHDHTVVELEKDVLQKNNLLAERNRGFLLAKNITAFNLVSSPGSGKTTLLVQTLKKLIPQFNVTVIEGDQQTMNDADKIAETSAKVVQVNTGKGCHLDAHMVLHAIEKLQPQNDSLLFIENVGNLVCPSLFDLGEKERVVIFSVTEGDDKPIKYPTIFESATACVIHKTDLLPYVDFDIEKAKDYALRVNPKLKFFEISSTKETGFDDWLSYLKNNLTVPTMT